MKIINLSVINKRVYTCNVYLVLGDWKKIEDVNTLIDVGREPAIIETIMGTATGIGKHKIDQVILTHSHYDHVSLLPEIKKVFNPAVYGFSSSLKEVDHLLKDGDDLKIGDRMFEVIHTPGHSSDSICLYCQDEGVLFSGDTPLLIQTVGGTYEDEFVTALEKLCRRDIKSIYFGHGNPLFVDCNNKIRISLKNVRESIKKIRISA